MLKDEGFLLIDCSVRHINIRINNKEKNFLVMGCKIYNNSSLK